MQACSLRDSIQKLSRQKLIVLGISPDPISRLKKFKDKEGLNFQLLSDEDHKIAEKYGVWGLKKFMGREFLGTVRSTFLIDPEGKIAKMWDPVKAKGHAEAVLEALTELQ